MMRSLPIVLALALTAAAAAASPALLIVEGSVLTDDGTLLQPGDWIMTGSVVETDSFTVLVSRSQVLMLGPGTPILVGGDPGPNGPGCACSCGGQHFFIPTHSEGLPDQATCDGMEGTPCVPSSSAALAGGGQLPVLKSCVPAYGPTT
jgi:hypothetical protein